MTRAVLATYARTPFTFARKGALAGVRPDDLAAAALKAVVERSGIDPATLDDVLLGCAYPEAAQGNNIARLASLGETVRRIGDILPRPPGEAATVVR